MKGEDATWQWGDELQERKLPSPEEQAVADAEHSLRMAAAGLWSGKRITALSGAV